MVIWNKIDCRTVIVKKFIGLVFGLGQEIPPVTKIWTTWSSQCIIFNYLKDFLPLGTKDSPSKEEGSAQRWFEGQASTSITASTQVQDRLLQIYSLSE